MSVNPSSDTQLEKIDITQFVDEFLHALKRTWLIVLVLTLAFGAFGYLRVRDSYVPEYIAEATVSVNVVSNGKMNNEKTAEQIGVIFPYILSSGILQDVVKEELGISSLGTIRASHLSNTNLLTIRVTSRNQMTSYNVLHSIITNFPKVARYVVGETELTIIDDSGIPEDTGKTVRIQSNVIRYAAVGLILGLVIAFFYMMIFRTVRSPRDIRSITNVECLGTLPLYQKKRRRTGNTGISIMEHNVQQDYLESMRLLRARILRRLDSNGHKVIMVTSSVPSEGKSTISSNLAMSLARRDKSVILVDCDLRSPSLHENFEVKSDQPGLLDVLTGQADLESSLVSYQDQGLHLKVLFGSRTQRTSQPEILGKEEMKEIVDLLKKQADIVILDTPPSAMLVDAMMAARYADEALYVIRCDYARRSVILNGLSELMDAGVEVGGCILNAVRASSGSYGYHSYGYGSKYYYGNKQSYGASDKKDSNKKNSNK